ncbi:MAG TPA: hybrid sensor histidine kinase/response regulator, partial [Myxococcales bacterium]|nr:hybrid sensor histidine kinase/response regulator [Myxococcales bacterium]
PVMDGYELGRRLLERGPVRIVAVTGYGQSSDRAKSVEAGFAAHLVKPVRKDELLAALAAAATPAPRA